MTLCVLLGGYYSSLTPTITKNWKDEFVKVRGRDGVSMVTTREDDTPRFLLTEDLVVIIGFNFDYLIHTDREVIHFLDEFEVMSLCILIELDQVKDIEINEYLHKPESIVIPNLLGLFDRLVIYNFIFPF